MHSHGLSQKAIPRESVAGGRPQPIYLSYHLTGFTVAIDNDVDA